ncbi:retrovirus-related pol polyprotein from transposon TNT 1-94-like protein [Citrus sinensis]|nr:retrovirus-related pol polyprotein from transposon TNT 1-94-like protein [Citrus sinensis]
MVVGETFRIGERSTKTISGDISGGRRDFSNRYSAPIIGGQKIDVEKFDGKINFSMWRREVIDALIQIDLDVVLKNKRHLYYDEEIWDRTKEKACGQIRSCLTEEVKYLVKDEECTMTLWRTLEEKCRLKSPENCLHAMSQVYGFRMKPGVSMHDHVSRFEKLLVDLKNLDENIKDEIKAIILLHSLPEEYSHFVTTLIYEKSVIIFKDVCTTLINLEIQNNDKNSERASSEALVSRDWAIEKKKKRENSKRLDLFQLYLISVGALEAKGYKITIKDGTIKFTHEAIVILQGVRRHNLYYLKRGTTDKANVVEAHSDTTKLWHVRLGHAREKSLQTLMRHKLLKGTKTCKLNLCEHCVVGKKTRVKFGTANHDTREILEYVHSDVWGPTKTASIGGSHYFVTFVDDFSRRVQKFWAEAVSYASHLINRLPSIAMGGKTPRERWSGKHAQDYDSLRIFGCPAYYHVKDSKLDPRARKTMFVGFKDRIKGFKLWDLEDKMFVCSRDVTFNEVSMMKVSSFQKVENKTTETWELMELPKEKKAIGNKWVYTKKKGSPNQSPPRYKTRLVAKGFAQKEDLEEEIYMTQPCGFKVAGKENHECRLIKYLYGLKQLPRLLDGAFIYLLLYVDEMLIVSKNRDKIERLKKQLPSEFEIKDLAPPFKLSSSSCPISQEERNYMAHVPYANVLAVKWILRYLYWTVDVGLLFNEDYGQQYVGYCNSDFAGNIDKRRSTTSYVFTLGGCPISWRLILQSKIALSTTEAEYTTATEAVKEVI